LSYSLGQLSTTAGISLATGFQVEVGVSAPNPALIVDPFADLTIPVPFDTATFPLDTTAGTIDMTGDGVAVDMGPVLHNNIPPTLTAAASYSGDEGAPITLAASATGPCAAGASYAWSFSDGGHEYGGGPKHTFADSGPYTGTVTVTDTTGLTATKDFGLTVANVAPKVTVIPTAPTIAWGRDLTMQAQAVDPGSADQSTLTYAWSFADNTPVVTGGASQTHQWATPGAYAASVNVCDKDAGCTLRTFTVTVRQRATSLAYTGVHTGVYSAPTSLSASLVDEYGAAVNGGAVDFTLGGNPGGSALTGAGTAAWNDTVTLPAGASTAAAAFTGNVLYAAAAPASAVFTVTSMGTSLVYTGSLAGSPNKNVTLTARLVDTLGRPLAAMPITYQLGAQSAGPGLITGATGVSTTTLQLNQKPGIYQLTSAYAGVAGHYAPASDTRSFSLNKK
jgi:PKD repeat protein